MTIPEEIEQLKIKLEQTADEREQAEVLLEILDKYRSLTNPHSQPFVDSLLQLAEKLNEPFIKARGLYYSAINKSIIGQYDLSINLCQQALSLFELPKEQKYVAHCYNTIGLVYGFQGNYSESLKNHFACLEIGKETGDIALITNSYENIGSVYRQLGNYSEALANHSAALKLFEELNYQSKIATSYVNFGNVYVSQGNYEAALKNYLASLKSHELVGDQSGMAVSHLNIGYVYSEQGNYPEALKNYYVSLKIRKQIGNPKSIAFTYEKIGRVYAAQGNETEALKNDLAALEISQEIRDQSGIASGFHNIGYNYVKQGNYAKGLKNLMSALKIYEEIKEKPGIANAHQGIGEVYTKQENYSEALKSHFTALKIREEIGNKSGIADSYINIGNVYEKEGNYPDALKMHLQALKIAEEIGDKEAIKESSLSLSYTNKALGDFENALKYYEKYHEVEKEMLGEESTKQFTQLSFTHNLEQKEKDLEIEQLRNVELKKERDRSEALLLNILPVEVAEELKEKGSANAKLFDDVTVLFTDFKSFTKVSERLTPQQLVDELNVCFSAFDEIMTRYNIEKIKTVGDAYLAVSGLPVATANHATDVINAAIEIREFIKQRKAEKGDDTFDIRIGVHSGSVVAGIVGVKKFAYDIWGDTVNTAARMEQNSEAGKINISETTYGLVKDQFNCIYRGEIEAKNKGKLKMYFVMDK